MPRKKKSNNKIIPPDASKMAEAVEDQNKELEASDYSSGHDIDPTKSVEIIQDIFKGRVDPDVVSMVFSECEFNVDQAVETLFTLLDDTVSEATGTENKSTGIYGEMYTPDCSPSDDETNSNRVSSLCEWPTLQSACSFKQYHMRNKKQGGKNAAHTSSSSSEPYVTSSTSVEMLHNSDSLHNIAADITRSVQDECIQAIPDVDSSNAMCQDQNMLLPQSVNKTISEICKSYASSIQNSSIEHCQEPVDKLVDDLPKFDFGNCVLDNQRMFIVPKLNTSETISHNSPVTLSNPEVLQQTPNFLKCLNYGIIETKQDTLNLNTILDNELLSFNSSNEKKIQVGTSNSNLSARQAVNAYMRIGKKLLVILRGLPGSGKSTLAWALQSEFSASVFSTDDFFLKNGKYSMDFSALSKAHEWNRMRAEAAMANGEFLVIIDNTNIEAWEMKPYVALGLKYGYFMEILEPETSWKFNINQLAKRNIHGISKVKITRMLERYDHNISLGDIIDEINSKNLSSSLMITDPGNISTNIASRVPVIGTSGQKDEQEFNAIPLGYSVDFGMPTSFCKENSTMNESHTDEDKRENDAKKDGAVAPVEYSIIDFHKNGRIEIEGEKNLCLDELFGLLYDSEESLSHHTSLSCSSQDVSAWEAITELDDDFLWTADTLPAVTSNTNELSEIDEANENIEDVSLMTDNISEIGTIQTNCPEANSAKIPLEEKEDNAVCIEAKNQTEEDIISEICSVPVEIIDKKCITTANSDDNTVSDVTEACSLPLVSTDETYLAALSNAYSETNNDVNSMCPIPLVNAGETYLVTPNSANEINELCSMPVVSLNEEYIKKTNDINNETAGDMCTEILNSIREEVCTDLIWKESASPELAADSEVPLCCSELLQELKISDDDNSDDSLKDERNTDNNDPTEIKNSLLVLSKQTIMFPESHDLKANIQEWENTVVDNADWDSDKSADNNSSGKMEPKPQRQRRSKPQREHVMNHEENSGNKNENSSNQEIAVHVHSSGGSGSELVSEHCKSYWTRSNKKSKVAARLTYGLENKANSNESYFYLKRFKEEEEEPKFSGHDSSCLHHSAMKEDRATQICLQDFLLLQRTHFKSICDNSELNSVQVSDSFVCNYNSECLSNDVTSSHCNVAVNSKTQHHPLLESLKHYFPSVPEEELQYALDYSNYDLREAACVLIRFGFHVTNETKEFMFPSTENSSCCNCQKTEMNMNCEGIVSDMVLQPSDTAESLEDVKASSVKNCPSSLVERKLVASSPLKLELRLDREIAQQLQKLFGPVGCNLSEDLSSSNDRTVEIDMDLAKMLHHCWAESQKRQCEGGEVT